MMVSMDVSISSRMSCDISLHSRHYQFTKAVFNVRHESKKHFYDLSHGTFVLVFPPFLMPGLTKNERTTCKWTVSDRNFLIIWVYLQRKRCGDLVKLRYLLFRNMVGNLYDDLLVWSYNHMLHRAKMCTESLSFIASIACAVALHFDYSSNQFW